MKIYKLILLTILPISIVTGQEIGIDFNIGYSDVQMEQVNDYLDNSSSVDFASLLTKPLTYNKFGLDLMYEAGISVRFSQLDLSLSGNYLTTTGYWESFDTVKNIKHDITVSTFEILASVGYNFPIYKTASLLVEGGIGYGFASSEISYTTNSFPFFMNWKI